jgi:hypothetical protein
MKGISHPELFKSSSNNPSPHHKGITTYFLMVVGRVRVGFNPTLTLPTTIKKYVKGDFSRMRKIRDDS